MKTYLVFKRIMDTFFALILLVLVMPIMLITGIAIRLESRGPVLFKQERLGKQGKIFLIYKFRSMVQNAEKQGTGVYSFKGDTRVTRVGAFIRKSSIDELPQLFNIIKGEMSFIGPRPTLTYHPWPLEEYTSEQKRRFRVLPGVSGLAQVKGRKKINWDERIIYDIEYVNSIGLMMDVKLLLMTISKVILMKDNENVSQTVR